MTKTVAQSLRKIIAEPDFFFQYFLSLGWVIEKKTAHTAMIFHQMGDFIRRCG